MERRIRTDFRPRYKNTGSAPTTGAERGIGGNCKCNCNDGNQHGQIFRNCYSFGEPCAEICVQCCKHDNKEQEDGSAAAFFNGNSSRDSNCNSFNNRNMFDQFNGFTGFKRDSFNGVRYRNFEYARGRGSLTPLGGNPAERAVADGDDICDQPKCGNMGGVYRRCRKNGCTCTDMSVPNGQCVSEKSRRGQIGIAQQKKMGLRDASGRKVNLTPQQVAVRPTGGTTPSGDKQGGCPPCDCKMTIVQFNGETASVTYCCNTGARCGSAGAFTGIYPEDVKEAYITNKEGVTIPATNQINRFLMEDNVTHRKSQSVDLFEAAAKAGLEVVDEREFVNFLDCRCRCLHTAYGNIQGGADPMPIFCCGSGGARCGWGYRSGARFVLVDFPTQIKQPDLVKKRNFSGRDTSNGGFRLR